MAKAFPRVFADFDDLSDVETYVIDQSVAGEIAKLGEAVPEEASDAVRVRSSLLRYLALGGCDAKPVHEKGVRIVGGWIDGVLDLELCRGVRQLYLERCRIEAIRAMEAEIDWVLLSGSESGPLNFQGAKVRGHVFLKDGFRAKGEVSLHGAQIGGQLECSQGTFENEGGVALEAHGVNVTGSVLLGKGFTAKGEVSLATAQIGGFLDCGQGTFENKGGMALFAQGAHVSGFVFLTNGFSAEGAVSLSSAQIGGQLSCTRGRFNNEGGVALYAQGTTVGGNVFLRNGFAAKGEVRLVSAQIGGQLDCSQGTFENSGSNALVAQSAIFQGDVILCDGFEAIGVVSLSGALIKGELECSGGRFRDSGGNAIFARHLVVEESVYMNAGFVAEGRVDLTGARIAGDLDCTRGSFSAEHGAAFEGRSMDVSQIFTWRDVTVASGDVVLTQARVGGLADDLGRDGKADSWPGDGRLKMDGFVYDRFVYGDSSARKRLAWVGRHSSTDFQPQPHQQLARVVGEMGHRFDRGRVLIAMEKELRAQSRKDMGRSRHWQVRAWAPMKGLWYHMLGALVGYGYRPFRALFWGFGVIALTCVASWLVWEAGDFAPASGPILASAAWQAVATSGVENAAATWSAVGGAGQDYETFRPWIYAVDVVVPLVNLGQDAAWAPSTARGFAGIAWHHLEWVVRLAGWVLAAISAGAVAGVIRHE